MELSVLDNNSLIELKAAIAKLEGRVEQLKAIRVKQDVPLEVLLEQSSYKYVWDEGYIEGEANARDIAGAVPLDEKKLAYSPLLESGKRYKVVGGVASFFAIKIFDGTGLFELGYSYGGNDYHFCTFTAIPEERYVLFEQALISTGDAEILVKELEGHIRYVFAMSTFLNPELKEVL